MEVVSAHIVNHRTFSHGRPTIRSGKVVSEVHLGTLPQQWSYNQSSSDLRHFSSPSWPWCFVNLVYFVLHMGVVESEPIGRVSTAIECMRARGHSTWDFIMLLDQYE